MLCPRQLERRYDQVDMNRSGGRSTSSGCVGDVRKHMRVDGLTAAFPAAATPSSGSTATVLANEPRCQVAVAGCVSMQGMATEKE